jgi:TetR/AcrR family transcriptional regulator
LARRKVPPNTTTTAPESGRTRDADRTRKSIIRHATREFSARGFDGARVDNIADSCRLSKNTLYYHFDSKDGLITAVLEEMYIDLRSRQGDTLLATDDPAEALRHVISQTFQAFSANPHIIRLLNEENLHKAKHIKKSVLLRMLYDPLVDRIAGILKSGAEKKIFKPGIDPVFIYLTLSAMAYHFISNSFTLEIALGRELSSEKAREDWANHIFDVILTYCMRGSRTEPKSIKSEEQATSG